MFSESDFENIQDGIKSRKTNLGIYRGTVEYNNDPLGLGRCLVRVIDFDGIRPLKTGGTDTSIFTDIKPLNVAFPKGSPHIKTEYLPWANPINLTGGFDSGQFSIPLIGSQVWVLFEQGSLQQRLYFGGSFSIPRHVENYNEYTLNDTHYGGLNLFGGTYWPAGEQSEVPVEARDLFGGVPTVSTIFKSPKGHSLYYNDRDTGEELVLVDRAGQALLMEARVSSYSNIHNEYRRRYGTVRDRVFIDSTQLYNPDPKLGLYGMFGQKMEFSGGSESVSLQASNGDNVSCDRIELAVGVNKQIKVSVRSGLVKDYSLTETEFGYKLAESNERKTVRCKELTIIADKIIFESDLLVTGNLTVLGTVNNCG